MKCFTRRNILTGLVIYTAGDTLAAVILNQWMWTRTAGMMLMGGLVYACEVPAWFAWIDQKTDSVAHRSKRIAVRTALAMLYFNPLWIARHLCAIACFSGKFTEIEWSLLQTASISWCVNIPLALIGNAIIQGVLPLRWRFAGSALFSGLMAVYYAMSGVWFHA